MINDVFNYLLELYFDFDDIDSQSEENEEDKIQTENLIDNDENELEIDYSESENNDVILNFDQFYPIEKKEIIKPKKRNYMEAFGESNDLKKYLDSIGLPEPNSPENI